MGLRDTLSKGAQTAFTAAGDVPASTWYYTRGSAVYDASTGVVSTGVTMALVSFIFTAYKQHQIDGEHVLPSDMKAIIPQANISAVPVVDDYLFRKEAGVSVRYDVVGRSKDPADALWILQVRKP